MPAPIQAFLDSLSQVLTTSSSVLSWQFYKPLGSIYFIAFCMLSYLFSCLCHQQMKTCVLFVCAMPYSTKHRTLYMVINC